MIRCLRRWLCRLALLLPVGSLAAAAESVPMHDTLELPSRALGEMRRVHVYRPPHYDAQPDARFPVLYMPDGGVAEDFPHVVTTLDAGVRAGEIAPMLPSPACKNWSRCTISTSARLIPTTPSPWPMWLRRCKNS